jgi:hypothetical protein
MERNSKRGREEATARAFILDSKCGGSSSHWRVGLRRVADRLFLTRGTIYGGRPVGLEKLRGPAAPVQWQLLELCALFFFTNEF